MQDQETVRRRIEEIKGAIEHTLLKPEATEEEIQKVCEDATKHGLFGVCIAPCWLKFAKTILGDSGVTLVTVIGFPHGTQTPRTKEYEAREAFDLGATEVDMVINIGWLMSEKFGKIGDVENDIRGVVRASADSTERKVKVILETALLKDPEIIKEGCRCAESAGAHFVKTSTGFSTGGATRDDVKLMRKTVSGQIGVKAAGGVRDFNAACEMLDAGATRLGTSKSLEIVGIA